MRIRVIHDRGIDYEELVVVNISFEHPASGSFLVVSSKSTYMFHDDTWETVKAFDLEKHQDPITIAIPKDIAAIMIQNLAVGYRLWRQVELIIDRKSIEVIVPILRKEVVAARVAALRMDESIMRMGDPRQGDANIQRNSNILSMINLAETENRLVPSDRYLSEIRNTELRMEQDNQRILQEMMSISPQTVETNLSLDEMRRLIADHIAGIDGNDESEDS